MPWALRGVELGDDVLEIGPGPGLATEQLWVWAPKLTAVEVDSGLADALRSRVAGRNVDVVTGDATAMPFEDGRFSAAVCFTMLHHVPSPELQDRLLAEVHRVLRPGGTFAGSDSTASLLFKLAHLRDTMVLVEPSGFGDRLRAAGFADIAVHPGHGAFRFRAIKPLEAR